MTFFQLRVLDAVAVLGQVHAADMRASTLRELVALGALEPIEGEAKWYRLTSLGRRVVDEQRTKAGAG